MEEKRKLMTRKERQKDKRTFVKLDITTNILPVPLPLL